VLARLSGLIFSSMGTRLRFLGWVPYQGFGTPLSLPALYDGNLIGHASGGGTGEPLRVLREEETIHLFRSPFGEGHGGVLAGRLGSGMDERPRGRQSAGHARKSREQEATPI
jgi:hypothetical protein